MTLVREMGSLRYMSALGLIGSLILLVVVVQEFFTNTLVVPDAWRKLDSAELVVFRWSNTVEAVPFIMFLYMYQALLPQSYKELHKRSILRMNKVVRRASVCMLFVYVPIGVFGYLTFADNLTNSLLSPKTSGNILECDYRGSQAI
jgi:amino acid permease